MEMEQPEFNWEPFYEMARNRGPGETVLAALKEIEGRGKRRKSANRAVDLGCGEGRDTMELLQRGWGVVAVDNTHNACERLQENAKKENLAHHLKVIEASFADARWGKADLINAFLALPYCPPSKFPQVWQKMVKSLKRGGYISCNLFGDRHTWSNLPFISRSTGAEVDELLKDLEVVSLKELEREALGAGGQKIVSHEFVILARKK